MNSQMNCSDMPAIREGFHNINSEATLNSFLESAEDVNCDLKTPYKASAIMRKAEYTSWPFKKLSYFKEGKQLLEDFVKSHPNNIEGRYVRLLTQVSLPGFLNYSDDKEADYNFINTHIAASDLPETYKREILLTINKIYK
ncbi:hypothetical protein [Formosa sp. PL04]|uniref:hypothetical protein n=1 Tax=Formosa sp. PL04 TaxID=3081755 RepID=UPI00298251A1|nr:hypothetical protein [Formosa sp. PL04]MDW5287499.1 hypothetical protein [Formosa sp. PL04]